MKSLDLEQFLSRLKSIISLARRFNTHSGIKASISELERFRNDFSKQGYFRESEEVELIIEFLTSEREEQELRRKKIVDLAFKLSQEIEVGRLVNFRFRNRTNLSGSVVGFLGDRVLIKVTDFGVKDDIYEVSPLDIKI